MQRVQHWLGASLIGIAQAAQAAPATPASAAAPVAASRNEANQVLFEVRVDQIAVSDAFSAYQFGRQTFLPLGELARLLTIAIRTQPEQGRASGFLLSEDRPFLLDLANGTVSAGDRSETFNPALVQVREDDIYVDSNLLSRWLPVDMTVDLSTLTLAVKPREPLPLQLRLAREQKASQVGTSSDVTVGTGYPLRELPYGWASMPLVDQTIGLNVARGSAPAVSSSTFVTADLAGMQSSLYLTGGNGGTSTNSRLTLARHDPQANLLGPLGARHVAFGSVAVPGVAGVSRTYATGNGFSVGNVPFDRPSSFDRHTFQGDLPPGWDVELYYNDALVAFQQSRADGKYVFEDRPLTYGANQFRLVFHGPQGQLRVERQSFLLAESQTGAGQVYYNAAAHRDIGGERHAVLQAEWGATPNISLNGALVKLQGADREQSYDKLGLLAYGGPLIFSADLAHQQGHGRLLDLGLKTRLGNMAVTGNHTRLGDYASDAYVASSDPVRTRDRIRVDGVLPFALLQRMPLTFEISRDRLQSGLRSSDASMLNAAFLSTFALSNQLQWHLAGAERSLSGSFQVGRSFGEIGVRGVLGYGLRPQRALNTAGVALDRPLGDDYRLAVDLVRQLSNPATNTTLSLTKTVGRFGMSLAVGHSTRGQLSAGAQLFFAIGREPRSANWFVSALPMGNSGSASARVFLDTNMNGVLDPGETAVKGAGFIVNGVMSPVRTDADGVATLAHLPAHGNADISVNGGTLEDPQWTSMPRGLRIVPRPGHIAELDFPLVITSEIDGTVYLATKSGKRGIGNVEMELIDDAGRVAAQGKSSSDGFFIVPFVMPGRYTLRVSEQQLRELKLRSDSAGRSVTITPDGKFVNGQDFIVSEAP